MALFVPSSWRACSRDVDLQSSRNYIAEGLSWVMLVPDTMVEPTKHLFADSYVTHAHRNRH
eukprot:4035031-Alexandrium_andersonii.AAC.1